MKKLILFALCVLFSNVDFAQMEKGTYVPGFVLNGIYSGAKTDDTNTSSKNYNWQAGLTLRFGKFIKENFLLSGSLGYSYSYSNYKLNAVSDPFFQNNTESKRNGTSIGVSLSKFKFITEKFAVSFGPNFSFSYSDGLSTTGHYESNLDVNNNQNYVYNKTTSYQNSIISQIYLSAAIHYFLTKNIALSGGLGAFSASYSTSPYLKEKKHTAQNSFNLSLNPSFNSFNLGLTFYIRPKTESK